MFTMKFCVNKYCEKKILVINRKIIKNHLKIKILHLIINLISYVKFFMLETL